MGRSQRERLGKDVRERPRSGFGAVGGVTEAIRTSERLATEQAAAPGGTTDELLGWFIYRDDGYLRIIPDGEGKFVYLKWKFNRRHFTGHYAFVSGYPGDIRGLLSKLREQIEAIHAGTRQPTPDRPYIE